MATKTSSFVGQTLGQGRYLVNRKLGEGGMAFVLLALDKNIGVDVVVKMPKPAVLADPEFTARFRREIRSMVELTHPHIVKITDVGEQDGMPFYVMDLLTGGSLEDRFETIGDKKKPQSPESLSDWLEPVAQALDFIHQRFVHRDIKPANILFDAYGNAFVSDFGIVKAISEGTDKKKQTVMTQAGMVIGTGPYMAPELTEGKEYDGRADQYALAATVYEALSGRVPFDGPTLPAIIMQQLTAKIPLLHTLVPTLPKTVTQAVQKGLSRNPNDRYPDCIGLAKAVLAAIKAAPATRSSSPRKVVADLTAPKAPKAVCPACRKAFALPADPAGKSVTCPACKAGFTVTQKPTPQVTPETNRFLSLQVSPETTQFLSLPSPETEVAPRKQATSRSATSQGTLAPILHLPKKLSRRVWLGVAIAIAVGILGLVAVAAALSAFLLWGGRGKIGEKNRP